MNLIPYCSFQENNRFSSVVLDTLQPMNPLIRAVKHFPTYSQMYGKPKDVFKPTKKFQTKIPVPMSTRTNYTIPKNQQFQYYRPNYLFFPDHLICISRNLIMLRETVIPVILNSIIFTLLRKIKLINLISLISITISHHKRTKIMTLLIQRHSKIFTQPPETTA